MDKRKLIESVIQQLEKDRLTLLEATQATLDAATHEENKPENEYDTRGLEASYLAGAQSKRVAEIEEALMICKNLQMRSFKSSDPIAVTALIELELEGKSLHVFLLPKGGGIHVQQEGHRIQVVTGHSPLGQALVGLKVGDVAIVESGAQSREYDVLAVQ